MFERGVVVRSTRDPKLFGPIVGYGVINWPTPGDITRVGTKPVYLVQVKPAS